MSVFALYEASKCIAMMNSVVLRAPLCSVSDRFQTWDKTASGSPDFSHDDLTISPRFMLKQYSHGVSNTYQQVIHSELQLSRRVFHTRQRVQVIEVEHELGRCSEQVSQQVADIAVQQVLLGAPYLFRQILVVVKLNISQ